jgi:four helix bundle protein
MVYLKSQEFPPDERFGLISQVRRSAVSIPSNIAEGYGRRSTGDYKRFLNMSVGSTNECLTQIELSFRLGFLNENEFNQLLDLGKEIGKMLNALISKL